MTSDSRMLRQAVNLATIFSKDPSTKVGFLAFDSQSHAILARGYNGLPRNFPDTDPALHVRPLKYDYFEHAERNGLYNEAQPYLSGSLALLTHSPSVSDARALISVQIACVIIMATEATNPSQLVAIDILRRNNTPVFVLSQNPNTTPTLTPHPLCPQSQYPLKLNKIVQNAAFLSSLTLEFSAPLPDQPPSGAMLLNTSTWSELAQGYGGYIQKTNPIPNWYEDPVRNAIFSLLRKHQLFSNATAAVSATSCIDCARALIASGFSRICCGQPSPDLEARWHQSFQDTRALCKALNCELSEVPLNSL